MRRFLPFALLSGLILLPAAASADELKIGYVNLQRVISEVEEGKAAMAALKARFERSQAQLDKEQETIRARQEELHKKRLAMDEATAQEKANELEQEIMRVSNVFNQLQRELSEEERQATSRILNRVEELIGTYAKKNGFTFIFDQGVGLLFGPPSLDLTDELIRLYNEAHKPTKK